jgi:hypothetical protein
MSETGQREWEIYEQVAGELLAKPSTALGLELERVEGKQTLPGESGTEWEIDRVGITNGGEKVVAIECRRYPDDTLNQQAIAAVAYTMRTSSALIAAKSLVPNAGISSRFRMPSYSALVRALSGRPATMRVSTHCCA